MSFNFSAPKDFANMPVACRKRKDVEEADDFEELYDRNAGIKSFRSWSSVVDGSQEAQFHPLPRELNLQLLANLGYNVTNSNQNFEATRQNGGFNHSPSSSSASDICPSTPNDVVLSLTDSYFAKGVCSEAGSSPAYPNFNIYPENSFPRPPGLLGMHMHHNSTQSIDSNGDMMDVDGEQGQAGPSHGPHCKSIPQLHCRGNGPTKELWARCMDCGTMSQVDSPRISEPLSYSP